VAVPTKEEVTREDIAEVVAKWTGICDENAKASAKTIASGRRTAPPCSGTRRGN
jgi:ATP-dependent Clp protease ATP-binding subunit ClpA